MPRVCGFISVWPECASGVWFFFAISLRAALTCMHRKSPHIPEPPAITPSCSDAMLVVAECCRIWCSSFARRYSSWSGGPTVPLHCCRNSPTIELCQVIRFCGEEFRTTSFKACIPQQNILKTKKSQSAKDFLPHFFCIFQSK